MEAPQFAPVEMFPCTYNDGKDAKDLMQLGKEFNKWLEGNDLTYTYWVLTPRFRAEDPEMDFAWIGSWANGAAMGNSYDNWMKDDAGVGPMFEDVMDCSYSLASAVDIRVPEGDWPKQSVVWFARCEREAGSGKGEEGRGKREYLRWMQLQRMLRRPLLCGNWSLVRLQVGPSCRL
ncbi:MAG: hypothetical protein ACI87W_001883 [Halieaceae bacterium]|jgi:hypothetical protein